jgi:hypothetical protein
MLLHNLNASSTRARTCGAEIPFTYFSQSVLWGYWERKKKSTIVFVPAKNEGARAYCFAACQNVRPGCFGCDYTCVMLFADKTAVTKWDEYHRDDVFHAFSPTEAEKSAQARAFAHLRPMHYLCIPITCKWCKRLRSEIVCVVYDE